MTTTCRIERVRFALSATIHDERRTRVRHSKKARATKYSSKKSKGARRVIISSSSPLGMLALHLLAEWKQSGRTGIVFLAESENRAERLGSVIHALDSACEVMVFPRLNT
ncbi:hypothetical protein, partial [Bradyrhizobium sp.]|uniref:hypothetical protein n=1 Tax=Bradyrhizobium sp. TaxID=376 RepID=UPI0025C19630